MASILVVDDERNTCDALAVILRTFRSTSLTWYSAM
jgi:hypothetical protein